MIGGLKISCGRYPCQSKISIHSLRGLNNGFFNKLSFGGHIGGGNKEGGVRFVYCWFLRIELPHPLSGLAEELGER